MKKRIYALVVVFTLIFTSFTFAHSGRTDSHGGHRDNKNRSGLGSYHYHCGGNPPHLHKNGVCSYSSPKPKAKTKVASASKKQLQSEKNIVVIVNGNTLAGSYAVQQDGRTIVSMRPICDALGVSLGWDSITQTAKGQRGKNIFQLTMGKKTAKINENSVQLDVPGRVKDGRSLVPLRFVAESLGAVVNFDNSSGVVTVTTNN